MRRSLWMVSWKRFLYLLMSPLILRKSSCSKTSMNSSTLSHIFASTWPLRSPRISARYGSPVFFGLTCFDTTTKLEVMTLFSCWQHSEMKNSFMSLRYQVREISCRDGTRVCTTAQPNLKYAQLLFLFQVLGVRFLGGGFHWLGLFRAGAGVDVSRLDIDESFFPQFCQISTKGGLKSLHVERVLNAGLDFFQSGDACHLVFRHFEDHEALLGADHIGHIARLQRKHAIFKFLGEHSTLEVTEIASLSGGRTVGVLLGKLLEVCAFVNLIEQVLRLSLGSGQSGLLAGGRRGERRCARSRIRSSHSFRSHQQFAEPNLLGLFQFRLVLLVKFLDLVFIQSHVRTYFLPNDSLRNDLVARLLFELFVGNALRFGGFFQFFHRGEIHLLAHLVEALDEFGVAGDAQVLPLLQQQLLVNQVAQDVALLFRDIRS